MLASPAPTCGAVGGHSGPSVQVQVPCPAVVIYMLKDHCPSPLQVMMSATAGLLLYCFVAGAGINAALSKAAQEAIAAQHKVVAQALKACFDVSMLLQVSMPRSTPRFSS